MQSKGKNKPGNSKREKKEQKIYIKKIYVETFHNLYSDIHRRLVENKRNYNFGVVTALLVKDSHMKRFFK